MSGVQKGLVWIGTLAIACGCGGDPPPEPRAVEAEPTSYREIAAKSYLATLFARYRNASSYHDRGIVRLGYVEAGKSRSKVAPASVWFHDNRLSMQAYDVSLHVGPDAKTAWINDPLTEDFDSQVLLQPGHVGRPDLSDLLSEPLLAQRISAGLAGPPPQLEWLFASEPMQRLFSADFRFQFGSSKTIERRLCRSVEVIAGQDVYRFWIDQPQQVIRRVDLPPVVAPPAPGEPLQEMTLTLELRDAEFESAAPRPDTGSAPARPKYVRHFVPLPPSPPDEILGTRPKASKMFQTSGRGERRPVTLVIRVAGDRQQLAGLQTVQQWHRRMPAQLRRKVQLVGLVDPDARNAIPAAIDMPMFGDPNQSAAVELDLPPGAGLLLDSTGRVVWKQPNLAVASAADFVTLGGIVSDVIQGIDVPKRVRQQWQQQRTLYQQQLESEAVR